MLKVRNISKTYDTALAVDNMSFEVAKGSIFGLVGPNGAGKSTTIRMIMNIIVPDKGSITLHNSPMNLATVSQIGYLPEERGLYKKMKVLDVLIFFGRLKGLTREEAKTRSLAWLSQFNLADWALKSCESLSKGMQQKVQFIGTVLFDPTLLILDEPFSGLDPLGMDILRETILNLKKRGTTIIFSSHQMEQVEKLCDDFCLINRGKRLLLGNLAEVKSSFGKSTIHISFNGSGDFIKELPFVKSAIDFGNYMEISLASLDHCQELLKTAAEQLKISKFEIVEPSLHDIFIETVGGDHV